MTSEMADKPLLRLFLNNANHLHSWPFGRLEKTPPRGAGRCDIIVHIFCSMQFVGELSIRPDIRNCCPWKQST